MSKPRGLPSLIVRLTSAVVILILGYFSLSYTVANVVADVSPALAHRLAPMDGQITALAAQQQFDLFPTGDPTSSPARLATVALREDPTAVKALTVLGLQAQLRNKGDRSSDIFAYAFRLTRRELQPSIWAMERNVEVGDIAGALRIDDIVLRTSQSGADLLFPVLGRALAEPKVRAELLRLMATKPVWSDDFINYLSAHPENPEAIVQFFTEGRNVGLPVDDLDRVEIVNALAAERHYEDAWRYYSSIRPGVARTRSRDEYMSRAAEAPTVFDWTPMASTGLSAAILRGANGVFDFAASPSASGVVLQQLQLLPPGRYVLRGHSLGIEQGDRSLPYWVLTCGARELGRVQVPRSNEAGGVFTGELAVPAECPTQLLALVVRPSDQFAGVSGQIDRVQLSPE